MLGLVMKKRIVLLSLVIAAVTPARAATVFQSGMNQVPFLEIYSSEGCSSCPPADAWLSGFKTNPALWKSIVPVSWHVDYWDQLGWRDPFATRNNSIRQKSEAGAVNTTTYTPGFFISGAEWRGFFEGKSLPSEKPVDVGNLRATQTAAREFIVEFTPTGSSSEPLDVYGALLGFDLSSNVSAGENRGKKLTHDFVVLGTSMKKLESHNGTYTVRMTLPNYSKAEPGKKAAAFWVSPAGGYATIQATGGFLAEELPDEP